MVAFLGVGYMGLSWVGVVSGPSRSLSLVLQNSDIGVMPCSFKQYK